MKIKMKLNISAYILTGFIVAITLTSIVINILILTETGRFVQGNKLITGISLACSIILFLICVALFLNTNYYFGKDNLFLWFGIIFLRLPYENVIAVAEEKLTKKLYLQYKSESKNKEFEIISININASQNDEFIKIILSKNSNIIINRNNAQNEDDDI